LSVFGAFGGGAAKPASVTESLIPASETIFRAGVFFDVLPGFPGCGTIVEGSRRNARHRGTVLGKRQLNGRPFIFRFQRLRKTRAPTHSGVSGVPSLPRFPEFPEEPFLKLDRFIGIPLERRTASLSKIRQIFLAGVRSALWTAPFRVSAIWWADVQSRRWEKRAKGLAFGAPMAHTSAAVPLSGVSVRSSPAMQDFSYTASTDLSFVDAPSSALRT